MLTTSSPAAGADSLAAAPPPPSPRADSPPPPPPAADPPPPPPPAAAAATVLAPPPAAAPPSPPDSPRADPPPAAAGAGAGAAPPRAPEVLHGRVPADPVVVEHETTGPSAGADISAGVAGAGGGPAGAGGAGVVPAVVSPVIAQAPFIFPQALKRLSPIQALLDSTKIEDGRKKPILYIRSEKGSSHEKFLNEIKEHAKDILDENDSQRIILVHNPGAHWTVYETSLSEKSITTHDIRGNGYCALTSAIVASELINGGVLPQDDGENDLLKKKPITDIGDNVFRFNIKTLGDSSNPEDSALEKEEKTKLLEGCFGDVTSLSEKSPKKLAYDDTVRLIDKKGVERIDKVDEKGETVLDNEGNAVKEDIWLKDEEILEVIKHRSPDRFVDINKISENQESAHESLSRTPHFERKVAFLKYLKDDQVKVSDDFSASMEGVKSEDLLSSDKSKYSGETTPLCLDVLDKFIKEDDLQDKNGKFLVFYKLMLDCAQHQDAWGASTDNRFAKLKKSFDDYAKGNDIKDKTDYKKAKQDLEKAEEELVKKYLLNPVRESFYNQLQINPKEASNNKKRNLQALEGLLVDISKKENGTFKVRIEGLSKRVNKKPSQFTGGFIDYFNCLNRRDPDFIPTIIPEILQLKPKIAFKGWGKKIEFKDGKILIDDQEVKEIKNDQDVDVIKELRNDFPQDSSKQDRPLFKHAVIDFFRNADKVTLVYDNKTEEKLEQVQKETLICKDTSKLFEKVVGNPQVDVFDTSELMLDRVKAHSKKTVGVGDEARAGGKAGAKVPLDKELTKTPETIEGKKQALEEIKQHLDTRFDLLNKMLKEDPNAIVVIPGFINDLGNEVYSLGTGLAVGQWSDTNLLQECQDHIKAKINDLKTNHRDQILLGNIGNQISQKTDSKGVAEEYFLPQFPIWEDEISYVRDASKDQVKLKLAEDRLIESYNSMCANLKIDLSTVPAKASDNQDDIIKAYQKLLFINNTKDRAHKPHFDGKKFIHVWGANCGNFNNAIGDPINGGGQAEAFKKSDEQGNKLGQKFGIFGIVTTIYNYDASQFGNADKTYGSPSPSPAPGGAAAAADLSRASSSASAASSASLHST